MLISLPAAQSDALMDVSKNPSCSQTEDGQQQIQDPC